MNSFADVIAKWTDLKELADDLASQDKAVSVVTVRSWRRRGIPGQYWHAVAQAAKARGYTEVTEELLCHLGARVPDPAEAVMEIGGV